MSRDLKPVALSKENGNILQASGQKFKCIDFNRLRPSCYSAEELSGHLQACS